MTGVGVGEMTWGGGGIPGGNDRGNVPGGGGGWGVGGCPRIRQ